MLWGGRGRSTRVFVGSLGEDGCFLRILCLNTEDRILYNLNIYIYIYIETHFGSQDKRTLRDYFSFRGFLDRTPIAIGVFRGEKAEGEEMVWRDFDA